MELLNLQKVGILNPQNNPESRKQFQSNFDWTVSMLQQDKIARIEDLLVEYFYIFAGHIALK